MSRKVQVIINPAAGQPVPILNTLNDVFHQAEIDWDIAITQEQGDAAHFAQEAVTAGVDVVAVYGGDGTVAEVVHGLQSSGIPLAILPGGTANLIAHELSLPLDLREAADLLTRETLPLYGIDIARVSGDFGDHLFMLRLLVGPKPDPVEPADRKLAEKYGLLATSVAAVQALQESDKTMYQVSIDGRSTTIEGFTCLIDNIGNMGFRDASFAQAVNLQDGFVDLIVIKDLHFRETYSLAAGVMDRTPEADTFQHWQARQLSIDAETPQAVYADGLFVGHTPVTITLLPERLPVLSLLALGQLLTPEPEKIDVKHGRKKDADYRLIMVKYPNRQVAETALERLKKLQKEEAINLADAVLVEKKGRGGLKIEPVSSKSAKKGLMRGGTAGLLVGVLVAAPALSVVLAGGAVGALWGKLGGRKLENRLKAELGDVLAPGETAICSIVDYEEWQKAQERRGEWGGELVTAELTDEEFAMLAGMAQHEEVATAVAQAES